jgi:hypothetical protein
VAACSSLLNFRPATKAGRAAERENHMVGRNLMPSSTSIVLSDEERAKRMTPGGRLPVATAKNNTYGDAGWTPLGHPTPAAVAAKAEREDTRAKPALVAKRASKGK